CVLMLRLAPPSTSFPYTTLFRSRPSFSSKRCSEIDGAITSTSPHYHERPSPDPSRLFDDHERCRDERGSGHRSRFAASPRCAGRSEEHTSELQSREKIVCRLLLE